LYRKFSVVHIENYEHVSHTEKKYYVHDSTSAQFHSKHSRESSYSAVATHFEKVLF